MFTLQEQQSRKRRVKKKCCDGVAVKCLPCGSQLGAENEMPQRSETERMLAPSEYGQVSAGQATAIQGIKLAASLALAMIPVVGWAAAILINIPVVGDKIFNFGMKYDPLVKTIMKSLRKATPMENCMNAWKYPEEKARFIQGMLSGTTPYSISNEIRQEYKLQRAREMPVPEYGVRQSNMLAIFTRLVDQNSQILQYECATRGEVRGQTGTSSDDRAKVDQFWADLKEAARQEEYSNLVGVLGIVVAQKQQVMQETRTAAIQFKLPEGVTSITKGGVLMVDPTKSMNKVILTAPMGAQHTIKAQQSGIPGMRN